MVIIRQDYYLKCFFLQVGGWGEILTFHFIVTGLFMLKGSGRSCYPNVTRASVRGQKLSSPAFNFFSFEVLQRFKN